MSTCRKGTVRSRHEREVVKVKNSSEIGFAQKQACSARKRIIFSHYTISSRTLCKFLVSSYLPPADNLHALIGKPCKCRTLGLIYSTNVTRPTTTHMVLTM